MTAHPTSTTTQPPPVVLVLDRYDDAAHTHAALAAHDSAAGRITLHPGPGTTSDTALAHDLLAALGKPPLLPGRYRPGRQPAWEAATAWIHAMPPARLTVLRAHRLTTRRLEQLLRLREATGITLTLVCHRPRPPRSTGLCTPCPTPSPATSAPPAATTTTAPPPPPRAFPRQRPSHARRRPGG
ncbi:hypothetical protein VSR01_37525 [Actinacidiphila sp. DG2A-62]|uniref:hypothetical protein n=1 Tax=Actinacidiphila sp. DG2A-62 TaxID=3108821 RepID=UPI002DBEF5FA|nr:hypothetical protein [Actinacidiphila sp. DG2A-62]MEC3998883.1 hypothetical protein [Actinacidiphila sp. DG2A-62]